MQRCRRWCPSTTWSAGSSARASYQRGPRVPARAKPSGRRPCHVTQTRALRSERAAMKKSCPRSASCEIAGSHACCHRELAYGGKQRSCDKQLTESHGIGKLVQLNGRDKGNQNLVKRRGGASVWRRSADTRNRVNFCRSWHFRRPFRANQPVQAAENAFRTLSSAI